MSDKNKQSPQGQPQADPKALGKALWALLWAQVAAQIGSDKNHGWVAKDSMAVIEAIVAEDASHSVAEKGKYTMSGECLQMVELVVNPSAFRQRLEKEGKLTASESKRTNSVKRLEAEFGEIPK